MYNVLLNEKARISLLNLFFILVGPFAIEAFRLDCVGGQTFGVL